MLELHSEATSLHNLQSITPKYNVRLLTDKIIQAEKHGRMPGPARSEVEHSLLKNLLMTGPWIKNDVRQDFFIPDLFAKMYDVKSLKMSAL